MPHFGAAGGGNNGRHLSCVELREGVVESQGCKGLSMSFAMLLKDILTKGQTWVLAGPMPVNSRKEHWPVSQTQVEETHHLVQHLGGITTNS